MKLPIVIIDGQAFYLDRRLHELRAVDNPHERIALTELEAETLPADCEIQTVRGETALRRELLFEVLGLLTAALAFLALLILF